MQKRYRATSKRIQDYTQKDTGLYAKGYRTIRKRIQDYRPKDTGLQGKDARHKATRIGYRDTRIGKNLFFIFLASILKHAILTYTFLSTAYSALKNRPTLELI